ncbi:MAG: hypothetical protein ACXVWF_07615 [Actinomycetota bacterium]
MTVRRSGLIVLLTFLAACTGKTGTVSPETTTNPSLMSPTESPAPSIEAAMLGAIRLGNVFPLPHSGYTGGVTCRLERPGGFHGADLYLCAFDLMNGSHQFEWGAVLNGYLHTHRSDPGHIPSAPRNPPW